MDELDNIRYSHLVKEFNSNYVLAMNQIKQGKRKNPRENYKRMLEIFNEIKEMDVNEGLKKEFYKRTELVYDKLQKKNYFLVGGIFIVAFFALLIFFNPSITGYATTSYNQAPIYTSGEFAIDIAPGESVSIDLDNYFEDPDGDELTYIGTNTPNLEVEVKQNLLIIRSKQDFVKGQIKIIASDLKKSISIPITVY